MVLLPSVVFIGHRAGICWVGSYRRTHGVMGMHFTAEKHGPVIVAGAAGFALGVAVHAVFATPAKPHAAVTPLKAMPAPPPSETGTVESVPNTPRVTTDDGTGDVNALKMALVVQLDSEQESLVGVRTPSFATIIPRLSMHQACLAPARGIERA